MYVYYILASYLYWNVDTKLFSESSLTWSSTLVRAGTLSLGALNYSASNSVNARARTVASYLLSRGICN